METFIEVSKQDEGKRSNTFALILCYVRFTRCETLVADDKMLLARRL